MCIRDSNGLLLIEQPDLHDDIKEGDEVTVVMNEHVDYNGKQYPICLLYTSPQYADSKKHKVV